MNITSVQHNEHGGYTVICDEGTLSVPEAPGNRHYEAIQAWLANGGEVDPVPPPSPEEIQTELTNEVQAYLDAEARTRNYDGILSLCTYATSTHPTFAAEGQAGVEWRDQVWSTCYQILEDVLNGVRPVPTREELLAELPVMVWP